MTPSERMSHWLCLDAGRRPRIRCGNIEVRRSLLREHADGTGCRIVLPKEPEAVLLGSAMLGAVAARRYDSVVAAMGAMSAAGRILEPQRGGIGRFHAAKCQVFHRLHADYLAYRRTMRSI